MQLKIGEDVYPFDLDGLRNDEADLIERSLGCSFAEFTGRVKGGYISAISTYVWVMRRRTDPGASLKDVRFALSDMDLLYDDSEARTVLKGQEGDARTQFLASLPAEQRDRLAGEVDADPLDSGETGSVEPDNAPAT